MSGDIIDRLVADLRVTPRLSAVRRLGLGVAAGAAVSVVLTAAVLGFRPDLARAVGEGMFWVKFAYTLALGGVALWACERLARPAAAAGGRLAWLPLPVLTLGGIAAWQILGARGPARAAMMMGHTAMVCPWCILAVAMPLLVGLLWAVRDLAPTRLRLTGTIVGVAAGGLGATVYALHCDESAAPFLVIWYTLGISAAGAIGWLIGPRCLRW